MPRPRPEWIGKTDAAPVPPRVRLRVFDAHSGICHWCKLPIKTGETWATDHVKALILGGENREANLGPIHGHCHFAKTGREQAQKSKDAAVRRKHLGIVDAPKMEGRPFPTTRKALARKVRAGEKPKLPPRRIYEAME